MDFGYLLDYKFTALHGTLKHTGNSAWIKPLVVFLSVELENIGEKGAVANNSNLKHVWHIRFPLI